MLVLRRLKFYYRLIDYFDSRKEKKYSLIKNLLNTINNKNLETKFIDLQIKHKNEKNNSMVYGIDCWSWC